MELRRGHRDTVRGPKERFAGDVWLEVLATPELPAKLEVASVHFTPGAHTAWHCHPHGQVLQVTEGAGLVQSRGGRPEHIHAGDTAIAEPGEWHWHGAGPSTFMTHIAIQAPGDDGATARWGEHLAEGEYPAG